MSQRILVVEDDAATRELISQYLTDNHFQVACAATGALAEASLHAEPVDLVLLDLNLPDQDGRGIKDTPTGRQPALAVIDRGLRSWRCWY